jgi:UDP-2-acetamido-3-amino-2,3-dideoxy-glucuronate N-acetyltransferase
LLGQNVNVDGGAGIGSNVKIQNNVSVYSGVEIEDDVFLGPSCVFTNISNPRSQVERHSLYERTLIKRGASIGANATVLCGLTIVATRSSERAPSSQRTFATMRWCSATPRGRLDG